MAKKVVRPEIKTVDKETGEVIVTPPILEDAIGDDETDAMMKRGMRRLFFRTPVTHQPSNKGTRTTVPYNATSLTQKHQAQDADINVIMKKFGVTGTLPLAPMPPTFLEVPDDLDMQSALHLVRQGQESFESLPAQTRAYFGNDLARFVAAVDQLRAAKDWDSIERMGLAVIRPERPQEPKKGGTPPPNPPDPPKAG